MITPFLIIYIFNWIVFAIIIFSLVRKSLKSNLKEVKTKKDKNPKSLIKQQFVIAITLSVLFGLGWGIGLLATEDIYGNKTARDLFASLFVVATAFHGLFIFVMHCLRSKDAQKVWKNWFTGVTGKELSDFTSVSFKHGVNRKRISVESRARKISTANYSSGYSAPEKKSSITMQESELKSFKKDTIEDEDVIQKGDLMGDDIVVKEIPAINAKESQDSRSEHNDLIEIAIEVVAEVVTNTTTSDSTTTTTAATAVAAAVTVNETKFTQSFPDEDDDDKYEKERLRQEEDRAYNAYHKKD